MQDQDHHHTEAMLQSVINPSMGSLAVQDIDAATKNPPSPLTSSEVEESTATLVQQCNILLNDLVSNDVKAIATTSIWSSMESLRASAKMLAIKLKSKDVEKIASIKPEYWGDTQKMLWAFNSIQDRKLMREKKSEVQSMLQLVVNPGFNFPSEYVEAGNVILARFEAEGWGEEPKNDEEDNEQSQDEQPKKKLRPTTTSTSIASSSQSRSTRHPADNHRIFGKEGIMKGILITQGQTKSYSINPLWPKKPADVFGANGLQVGDWWPMQIAALRDGAHGHRVGGISGTGVDGCRSVVVSKMYEDGKLDADVGDELRYSSVRGESVKAVKENNGTKALLRSQETQRPVRVLRASGGGWKGAPSHGIRYDGLYKVVSSRAVEKGEKEVYYQFELKRLPGQDPIDRSKPTPSQVRDFNRVSDGY